MPGRAFGGCGLCANLAAMSKRQSKKASFLSERTHRSLHQFGYFCYRRFRLGVALEFILVTFGPRLPLRTFRFVRHSILLLMRVRNTKAETARQGFSRMRFPAATTRLDLTYGLRSGHMRRRQSFEADAR